MEQQNAPENRNTPEVKESTTRSQQKKSHTGAKAGVTAAVILALLGGGYFGFGGGQGGLFPSGQSGEGSSAQESAIITESESEKESEVITTQEEEQDLKIVITESGIQYKGQDVSVTELEEALLKDFHEGLSVTVKDDHAIKSAYDEVTGLLSKLNIKFTEE